MRPAPSSVRAFSCPTPDQFHHQLHPNDGKFQAKNPAHLCTNAFVACRLKMDD